MGFISYDGCYDDCYGGCYDGCYDGWVFISSCNEGQEKRNTFLHTTVPKFHHV